jgi:hypothetical protein
MISPVIFYPLLGTTSTTAATTITMMLGEKVSIKALGKIHKKYDMVKGSGG